LIVGRPVARRLEIRLAHGNLLDVDADAYVLGMFRDVAPSGAARDLDAPLNGAIRAFVTRRMFRGNVGEVFVLPTGRHPVRASCILFTGLGPFDHFATGALRIAAENVIRTCVHSDLSDVAAVLVGAGSGHATEDAVRAVLTGVARGLRDADRQRRIRSVTLCERDASRYRAMKHAVVRLERSALFAGIDVRLDELRLPPPSPPVRAATRGPDPAYLIVRQQRGAPGTTRYLSAVLTAGGKAAVVSGATRVATAVLSGHLDRIEAFDFKSQSLARFGEQLAHFAIAPDVMQVLATMKDRHLVVVHDAGAARLPWETIRLGGWFPAAAAGLSRRHMAENLSVAKWLEQRGDDRRLTLLLVVNPTEDLDAAEREGTRLRRLFRRHAQMQLTVIHGAAATKATLLREFRSGQYDVVHYAGHAFFDDDHPGRSGIYCHRHEVLSGADLAGAGKLPGLVFFNACEAGRIRTPALRTDATLAIAQRIARNVGVAEAFLRGGVANYIGTYWSVADRVGLPFARTFYRGLLAGHSIGTALVAARREVRRRSVDWADYIHYGDHDFVVKSGEGVLAGD
jgi:hypothetical protein